jgi:hypothetical protein
MEEIIYAEPLGPRVKSVLPLDDYQLQLLFSNGECRKFDAKPLLDVRAFLPLRQKSFFETVRVAYGSIAWPGDIDYCPDTLYAQSIPAE